MSFKLVVWPPQRCAQQDWAQRIEAALPEVVDADALVAERRISEEALAAAEKLRWIHAAMVAPLPGWYHEALIEHPAVVTNPRGIYNDHISVHAARSCSPSRGNCIASCRRWRTGSGIRPPGARA